MKGQISLPLAADPDTTAPADSASHAGAGTAAYATAGHRASPSWLTELRQREIALWQSLTDASAGFNTQELSHRAVCVHADARAWLERIPDNAIHAVVTDPPYGLIEYEDEHQRKLKAGRGGVWRIPPSYDGAKRSPLPRFTVLSAEETAALTAFFAEVGAELLRVLVPGGHIFIASNPLLSSLTFAALQGAGLEKRGEVIRLVQTLRGGDRPKGAEAEFPEVSMMPRSCWEPWGIFRKPFTGTAATNLRRWGVGGIKRISPDEPFKDIIQSAPARGPERAAAPHPSLKPQAFLRRIVRAALPLGIGTVYDPFAGSGSTLAAAEVLGYRSIGTERSAEYCALAVAAFPILSGLQVPDSGRRISCSRSSAPASQRAGLRLGSLLHSSIST